MEISMRCVIFLGASEDQVEVTDEAWAYLSMSGTQWIKFMPTVDASSKVLQGHMLFQVIVCAMSGNWSMTRMGHA